MISGEDICCSVVFGTLVGVFAFSVMWSELLMTSAISSSSLFLSPFMLTCSMMRFLLLLLLGLSACVVFVVLGLSVRLSWVRL